MSRLGRYVGRARGGALRAVGAPRTPNLPSARAYARRAVQDAVPTVQPGRTARSGAASTGTSRSRSSTSFDGFVLALGAVAVALVIYLLTAPGPPPVDRPATTCADRVIWHGSRVQDCYRGEEP